ncbi:hypothetical protein ABC795_01360 [Blastococcus sp. HT6-30]|uniref:hypothetical protein n=1 Tax=Blastococcus sp. HT6-30 TaxID=3144843 RepID=UPI00321989D6
MEWVWVVGGLVVWMVLAAVVGVAVGQTIRAADRVRPGSRDVLTGPQGASPAPRARRRAVPLPPAGVALAALAVALPTTAFVLERRGSSGAAARLLSMDGPVSVADVFTAGLFAVAALAAILAAGRLPGRRTWWSAVSVVAAGIAVTKADGTLHTDAMAGVGTAIGTGAGVGVGSGAALVVIAGLWFLSRHERRDRRRVLGTLTLYAAASVGLSAVTWLVERAYGVASTLAAASTYLEAAGGALAGVAFLMAVLIGVAPRLVLPADWVLRRSADAHALEAADVLPGRTAGNLHGV